MKHVGFKTTFGLMFTAAAWLIWTVLWLFGSLLPNYIDWSFQQLNTAVTKYLYVSVVILIVMGIIIYLSHLIHRLFWKAEDTYLSPE